MGIKFIHVGMMKTATTYMQNVWLKDKQFALAHQGLLPVVQYLRQATKESNFNPRYAMNINVDKQPVATQDVILSSEGLSCAYLTELGEQPVRKYIGNAAELLGTLNKQTDNIFICVRSPVAWLRSMHSQFINEGQYGDGRRFMACKEQFLRDCLDLEFLVESYQRNFNNVVVMPFERLKEDEGSFWKTLAESFSIAVPSVKVVPVNESVSGIRLPLMSRLNEISHGIRDSLSASTVYRGPEKGMLIANSERDDKWLNRRFCQYGSDDEIQAMCDRVSLDCDLESFRAIQLSDSFCEWIEGQFIQPFEKITGDRGTASRYREELLLVKRP
jgi:hypothetical protein